MLLNLSNFSSSAYNYELNVFAVYLSSKSLTIKNSFILIAKWKIFGLEMYQRFTTSAQFFTPVSAVLIN